MPRRKHRVEEIIGKLREAEVELGRGHTVVDVCRQLGVSEQTRVNLRVYHDADLVMPAKTMLTGF